MPDKQELEPEPVTTRRSPVTQPVEEQQALSNRAVAGARGGGGAGRIAAALQQATELDTAALAVLKQLQEVTQPAHEANRRTHQALQRHAAEYRTAHTGFEATLKRAEVAAAEESAASVILGFAQSILIAVALGPVSGAVLGAAAGLRQAFNDALSEVGEIIVGAGVDALKPGPTTAPEAYAVPDDLDPRLKELDGWKQTAAAWQALAGLAQVGLDFAPVARRTAAVRGDLRAWATGGRGYADVDQLAAEVDLLAAAVRAVPLGRIAALGEAVGAFAALADHPLLERASFFLEQDLWIDWISRLSGLDLADATADMWPVWVTEEIVDILGNEEIEGRLHELALIAVCHSGTWGLEGMHQLNRLGVDHYFEGSEYSARQLFHAAVAARRKLRDQGAIGVALTGGRQAEVEVELVPTEAVEAWFTKLSWHPPLLPPVNDDTTPPHGRTIQAWTEYEVAAGDLVFVLGEYASGSTLVERVTDDRAVSKSARAWATAVLDPEVPFSLAP
ncbi:hypothetical protein ACQBAU_12570 [Propionibacteriaceae bacterium Y2011]|uniref:hypothetical protein n=1 Tax=Microlunatus sp. Y2014 TaxID=3418488 RepID=UPI003B4A1DE2